MRKVDTKKYYCPDTLEYRFTPSIINTSLRLRKISCAFSRFRNFHPVNVSVGIPQETDIHSTRSPPLSPEFERAWYGNCSSPSVVRRFRYFVPRFLFYLTFSRWKFFPRPLYSLLPPFFFFILICAPSLFRRVSLAQFALMKR